MTNAMDTYTLFHEAPTQYGTKFIHLNWLVVPAKQINDVKHLAAAALILTEVAPQQVGAQPMQAVSGRSRNQQLLDC